MKAPPFRGLALASLGVAALAVAQSTTMRPGQYEITVEMQLPGAPAPMQLTQKDCVTPDEATSFFKRMHSELAAEGCKLSEPVIAGNKVTWESECAGVTSTSELTFTGDGFAGTVRSVYEGQPLGFNVNARWIGATCTEEDGDE